MNNNLKKKETDGKPIYNFKTNYSRANTSEWGADKKSWRFRSREPESKKEDLGFRRNCSFSRGSKGLVKIL